MFLRGTRQPYGPQHTHVEHHLDGRRPPGSGGQAQPYGVLVDERGRAGVALLGRTDPVELRTEVVAEQRDRRRHRAKLERGGLPAVQRRRDGPGGRRDVRAEDAPLPGEPVHRQSASGEDQNGDDGHPPQATAALLRRRRGNLRRDPVRPDLPAATAEDARHPGGVPCGGVRVGRGRHGGVAVEFRGERPLRAGCRDLAAVAGPRSAGLGTEVRPVPRPLFGGGLLRRARGERGGRNPFGVTGGGRTPERDRRPGLPVGPVPVRPVPGLRFGDRDRVLRTARAAPSAGVPTCRVLR